MQICNENKLSDEKLLLNHKLWHTSLSNQTHDIYWYIGMVIFDFPTHRLSGILHAEFGKKYFVGFYAIKAYSAIRMLLGMWYDICF